MTLVAGMPTSPLRVSGLESCPTPLPQLPSVHSQRQQGVKAQQVGSLPPLWEMQPGPAPGKGLAWPQLSQASGEGSQRLGVSPCPSASEINRYFSLSKAARLASENSCWHGDRSRHRQHFQSIPENENVYCLADSVSQVPTLVASGAWHTQDGPEASARAQGALRS